MLMMFPAVSDFRWIGLGLIIFGATFVGLGILLFFDTALLAIGNILFLGGFALLVGPNRASSFFLQREKAKGTSTFFSGIVIVLIGWPFIGILIETVGFFMLFGSYLQTVVNFTKATPVYSYACKVPGVRQMFDYCDVHKFPV